MKEKITYSAKERHHGQNNLVRIHEAVAVVLRKLGGKVINSSYVLSEGFPVEAYGYYNFQNLGVVKTFLRCNNSDYLFSVNISGFDEDLEKCNWVKAYIEDTLKKVLY
jgi:hypothetical protein